MILCIDIGNTNIKYAVFENKTLKASYRVSSRHTRTADEYGATLINLLSSSNIKTTDIQGIIILNGCSNWILIIKDFPSETFPKRFQQK